MNLVSIEETGLTMTTSCRNIGRAMAAPKVLA
jgi:hypothetical protein